MSLILWIILGAVAGWIAGLITHSGGNILWDIILGIVGALVGGYLMQLVGQPGVTGFNIYSLIVAIIGAIILIWIGRLIRRSS
jgi:uncharacterized membrane protein YeaQ/YmgE (transglycosylase-associated protein family)